MTIELYDVTIIGGGPIGMFTTFYSGMRNLKTKLIESRCELGGKTAMFYPEKILRDIGGIPAISGEALVKQLKQQSSTFHPTIEYNQLISDLTIQGDGTFCLRSTTGEVHKTRTIILTVGNGIFKPIKLEVDGCEQFENHSLHYGIQNLGQFKGKDVCISGGGNSAMDWANELHSIAKSIRVIHRRNEFSGHESSIVDMQNQTTIFAPYEITHISGEKQQLKTVTVRNKENHKRKVLFIDQLIVNHGIKGEQGGIENWGLQIENDRFVVNAAMETNIRGIFAAGDAVMYPSKLKLITGGFAEGPIALNSAKKYLDPHSPEMAMYSTHHEKLLKPV